MATKVFVGNLSFKIGSEKLREEFSVAGSVISANIITRGPRSLGYGFVEFGSIEEAEKSVTLLNHKDIDGREINVEVAKPRAEPPAGEKEATSTGEKPLRQRRIRRPRAPRQQGQQQGQQQQGQQGQGQGQQQAPPARRQQQGQQGQGQQQQGQQGQQGQQPRRYRPRFQNQDSGASDGQQVNAGRNNVSNNAGSPPQDGGDRQKRPRRPRRRLPGQQQVQPQQGQQQQGQQQPQGQQQFQRKRTAPQPKKQQERVSSATTLFVANLPFSVDDKELAEIFSKDLKVVNAHVVKKRNTRSKGFGFVEFESEADQQAALKQFDGFTVHERVLNVKVALTAVPGAEGEKPEEDVAPVAEKKEEAKADAPKEEAAAPAEGEKKGQ